MPVSKRRKRFNDNLISKEKLKGRNEIQISSKLITCAVVDKKLKKKFTEKVVNYFAVNVCKRGKQLSLTLLVQVRNNETNTIAICP